MKILISLFIAIFILSGCGSAKRVIVKQKEIPSWYHNQAKTTENTLYSVGEGKNKAEAISNALNSMASTLNVSIESEFNTKSIVRDGDVQSNQSITTNDVWSTVEKVRISHYEIINYNEFGFQRYLVAIKSDKRKLFLSLKKELEHKFLVIQKRNKEAKKYNAIKELSIYKEGVESTYDVKNIVAVMGSLNSTFDGSKYITKLQDSKNRYESLLSKISFYIDSNRDALILRPVIGKGLTSKGFSLKHTKAREHFKVYIESDTIRTNSYGFDLARSAIFIVVLDNSGTVVGSNKLNITGQSTQGYKFAKESVAIKLNAMVKNEGISSVIGLEL